MTFHPGEIIIFNKAGTRLGVVTGWSVTVPRSFVIGDMPDFEFYIPYRDDQGNVVLTSGVVALIADDNLLYVEDELAGIPGWGGYIDQHSFSNERLTVTCLGGIGLMTSIQTDAPIVQSGGFASGVAARLVAAANAKKAAHGDLTLGFVADDTNARYATGTSLGITPQLAGPLPLYGTYSFGGDLYEGLRTLATDTLGEFWAEPVLGSGGGSLAFNVHWDRRTAVDHRDITIRDGTGGALVAGAEFLFSDRETLNHIVLKGAQTDLAQHLDYDCIKSIVKDISPQVEITLEGAPNIRYREDLTLSVTFGLSDEMQKQIAATGWTDPVTGEFRPSIQDTYLGYYRSFLYAYHNRQGKPFLEGYDWAGPDGSNDKSLTEKYARTWNRIGESRGTTVVTSTSDPGLPNGTIEDWSLDTTINPVAGGATGVALDWGSQQDHWIADKNTGNLVLLDGNDNVTTTVWGSVAGAGELLSVATDPASIDEIWVLLTGGRIRQYDINSNALISQYTLPGGISANDIAVDAQTGLLYVVGTGSPTVHVLDLFSGSAITPDTSFASGLTAPTGISISGGIAYISDGSGHINMRFLTDGSLAGTFSSGVSISSMYVDLSNRHIWVVLSNGAITLYHAYVAIGTVTSGGGISGAPGFDEIHIGQFLHIVVHTNAAAGPATTSTAGASTTYTVRAPIGNNHDSLWKIAVKFYGNGSLWRTIYKANLAVIGSNPSLIFPGQVLRIPNAKQTPPPQPPATRYLFVYTAAHFEQETIPGPIDQPDQLLRQWTITGDQKVGWALEGSNYGNIRTVDPAIIISGEEGRVCDWNPTLDGYGMLKEQQIYRTRAGHVIRAGHGWYPQDWDVPDRAFEPPNDPVWPEGEAYAMDYLLHKNRGVTVQTIKVTNVDGLWGHIEHGGVYHLQSTEQAPPGSPMSLDVRVLAFSPNEFAGTMDVVCEVY